MSNVFAVEQLLISRIADNVPAFVEVGTVAKLSGYQFDQIPLPACYVVPGKAEVVGEPHDGGVQIERQEWQVVICVPFIDDTTDETNTATKAAGELIYQVAQQVIGWRPAQGFQPFAYRGRPEPYLESGYGEFPALFETGLVLAGI